MFYDIFCQLCDEKGLTPSGAAAKMGFSRSTVTMWKNSGKAPKEDLLRKIASFFNVSIDYLLGKTSWKNKSVWYCIDRNLDEIGMSLDGSVSNDDICIYINYPDGVLEINFDIVGPEIACRRGKELLQYLSDLKKEAANDFRAYPPDVNTEPVPLPDSPPTTDNRNNELLAQGILMPIKTQKIPLLGKIAAGQPIFADEDFESYVEVGATVKCDYCLHVQGDSMINARVYDGDIVFIRKQSNVDDGEIAVVLIEDEATLKRVYHGHNCITLVAENPKYKPILITEDDFLQVRILGKAVAFQSDLI